MNEDEQYSKLLIDNHCIFLQIREYQRCCSYPARAYGFILGCWWEAVLLIFLVFCVVYFTLLVIALCRVYPMLPMPLDCPFWIATSVFSNVYLYTTARHICGYVQ